MKQDSRGFVALMSAILISAILLVLIFTLNISSFFNRFNVFDSENKRVSLGLAEACVNVGLLRIGQGAATTGCVPVEGSNCATTDKKCTIDSVDLTQNIVRTSAVYQGAFTHLCVKADASLAINGWKELPTSASLCTFP